MFERKIWLSATLCWSLSLIFGCSGSQNEPPTSPQQKEKPVLSAPIPRASPSSPAAGEPELYLTVDANDAVLGGPNASVTLFAFLDFQCPYCAQGFASLQRIRQRYKANEVRIVFKHLPLKFHDQALPAAVAAQAVQNLAGPEAFWLFAGRVFSAQQEIDYLKLARWAEDAGVLLEDYNAAVTDEATVREVAADQSAAQQVGVNGTPAFFINGKAVNGAQPDDVFFKNIDEELLAFPPTTNRDEWLKGYTARVAWNLKNHVIHEILAEDPHDYRVPIGDSPSTGPADAPITFIYFTDFECPYCQKVEPTVSEIKRIYGEKVRVVFKHHPLAFHRQSRPAHRVAAAVNRLKGSAAFFRFSQELFESSPNLSPNYLIAAAERQGLSSEEATTALDQITGPSEAAILTDERTAADVLVRGTPHFFINGKRLAGAKSLAYFQALIDHQLQEADALVKTGVKPEDLYAKIQASAIAPGAPKKVAPFDSPSTSPTWGPESASHEVHIFSDFECPFCRRGELIVEQLKKLYPDQVRVIWHDLPLPFHKFALPAARAARYAQRQGGDALFWKMHDGIFSLSTPKARLTTEEVVDFGESIGLNREQLAAAMSDNSNDAVFQADNSLAASLGIDGTPAF
ncbi:MAG: thioredoxin domain-containing protein, partial [Polyangiaceae bacterium]|nr:thioredoxin domain-containing protein [Polyangiaceae bacterium]